MRTKKHDELRPKRLSTVFFHNLTFFLTFADALKTKVGDIVGCIFEVECSVGGFLILKQIIRTITIIKFWTNFCHIKKNTLNHALWKLSHER
jgi:hypothetical protein